VMSGVLLVLWRITRDDRELAPWLAPGVALVATLLFYPMLELVRLALTNSGTGTAASR